MRTHYKLFIEDISWLYLPTILMIVVLFFMGKDTNATEEGIQFSFIASIMFGQSISKIRNINPSDAWALEKVSMLGVICSISLAITLTVEQHTSDVFSKVVLMQKSSVGMAVFALVYSGYISYRQAKNNDKK